MNIEWKDVKELVYDQMIEYMKMFLYEENSPETWNQISAGLHCIVAPLKKNGILAEYVVKCDDTINTNEVIDNNEFHCVLGWKVNATDEFTIVKFVLSPGGIYVNGI